MSDELVLAGILVQELTDALEEVSATDSHYLDREPCWCPSQAPDGRHSDACEKARAALKKAGARALAREDVNPSRICRKCDHDEHGAACTDHKTVTGGPCRCEYSSRFARSEEALEMLRAVETAPVAALRAASERLLAMLPTCDNWVSPSDCWTENDRALCNQCFARRVLERAPAQGAVVRGAVTEAEGLITFHSYDSEAEIRVVCAGGQNVEIDKLYGPLVACGVRVRLDVNAAEWVVERERIPREGDPSWEEVTRFGCQDSIDFEEGPA